MVGTSEAKYITKKRETYAIIGGTKSGFTEEWK